MAFGIDYTSGPPIAAMQAHDPYVEFVCRYVGYFQGYNLNAIATPQGKVLTPGEARANSQAGIATVSNYEWYASRATESASSGVWDAHTADAIHKACGGPADRPIYFSVDEDVAGSQTLDYFKGVESVIGLARTGAYGSFRVLQYLFDAHAITWGWQTYAWSGGAWEPRAHIRQTQNNVVFANARVDYNQSMTPDYGQWRIGGLSMIPQGWTDDGQVLTAPNGHKVVLGFREWVLNYPGGWPAWNQPLEEEWHADPLELSNLSLGAGQKQSFNATTLEYTDHVFESWQGQEIVALRAEIATLKANPPAPAPIDISTVEADLNAIVDAIAAPIAQALTDLKKL